MNLLMMGGSRILALLALGIALSGCISTEAEPLCAGCNVILISVDALRADHVSSYGYGRNTTPTIDHMARSSLVYERAYSHSSWTRPSMGSVMTGKLPRRHGAYTEGRESFLDGSHETLAKTLKGMGYATSAHVAIGNVKDEFGFGHGFDSFSFYNRSYRAGGMLKEATEWATRQDGPFFLWVHPSEPHFPYSPPKGYGSMFKEGMLKGEGSDGMSCTFRFDQDEDPINVDVVMDEKLLMDMLNAYDGEIRYLDDELGVFFYKLNEMGLAENTLVIITADHGEQFMDHGGMFHGNALHEELLRVPLIIYVPHVPPARTRALAGLTDIYPTVAELVGAPKPGDIDGSSLMSGVERELVYAETDYRDNRMAALVYEGEKVVHDYKSGETYYYSLSADSGERIPTRLEGPDEKTYLDIMEGRRSRQHTPSGESQVSEETAEQLREIGYVI